MSNCDPDSSQCPDTPSALSHTTHLHWSQIQVCFLHFSVCSHFPSLKYRPLPHSHLSQETIYIWFIKTGNYIILPGMLCTRVTTDLELTADHVTAFPLWQRCDHREGSASKREGAYGTLCGFCCEPKTSETITSKNCILPGEAVHSFDPGTRRQSQVDL